VGGKHDILDVTYSLVKGFPQTSRVLICLVLIAYYRHDDKANGVPLVSCLDRNSPVYLLIGGPVQQD
jgi:hypothetical protein